METRVILVRHGQTVWNVEQRFRGQADVPLDETGQLQAKLTADYIAARWPLCAVYASPLQRATDTGRAIAEAQGLEVSPQDELLDISFGELQGMSIDKALELYPEIVNRWSESPHTTLFPGGEGLDTVQQRSTQALREAVDSHPGETIALVAHTVLNRVLLCAVLGLGNEHFWLLGQATCAINVIKWERERYLLDLMNDTSHLWQAKAV
jgi:broad specificity phosphatase PhoE